mmetsp:Transcript_14441/g.21073  ORF Transcript_14441/g.21073 Transcript_14441/m.21073 type:complete len:82 (+) Transcript_14441:7-252(+)
MLRGLTKFRSLAALSRVQMRCMHCQQLQTFKNNRLATSYLMNLAFQEFRFLHSNSEEEELKRAYEEELNLKLCWEPIQATN